MRYRKKYSLLFCLMFVCQLLMSQDIPYIQYTIEDGLPSMKTYQIIQDSSGLLWIGTENGLVSFDGIDFVRYSHPDLLDNDIIQISISKKGRIYFFNLSQQLCFVENNQVYIIDNVNSNIKMFGLIAYQGKDYLVSTETSKNIAYEIVEVSDNQFEFIHTEINLFNPEEEKLYSHIGGNYYCHSDSSILSYTKSNVASTDKYYCFNYPYTRIHIYPIDSTLWEYLHGRNYARAVKQKENIFLIENNNVIHYDLSKKVFTSLITESPVNTVFIDMESNIWMSTADKGLLRATNSLNILNLEPNAIREGVYSIQSDQNGNNYIGTVTGNLIINPLHTAKVIEVSEKSRPVKILHNENKVIAFSDHGIVEIDNSVQNFKKLRKSVSGFKSMCYHDSKIYLATLAFTYWNRFDYYFNVQNRGLPPNKARSKNRITHIQSSNHDSTLLVCTVKGLAYQEGDTMIHSKNKLLSSVHITSIVGMEDSTIWIGTRTNGILNVKNDSIIDYFDEDKGLISNSINNIDFHDSELLISTTNGLSIFNTSTHKIKSLNSFNLLPSNNVHVSKVIEGNYWIGTSKGLTILTKEQINDARSLKPQLSIKDFMINGIIHDYTSQMHIDHTNNNVQINFQNISYKSGREKSIKYRISSIDTAWTNTSDNYISLPSLNPGKYMVEAIGVSSVGTESIPQYISFTIQPPWWETIWGRSLILLFAIAVGSAIFYFRLRRENQKRIYLTQINRVKDQALQLQMNPHFIFNSLNAIQGFIGTEDEELAMNYLARFARLIRLIFEHSKDNTISLEEEIEFIQLYLDLEKLRFKDKVEISLIVDPDLDAIKDMIHVPPLLIQPIVENSFKHGLFHKKSMGKININFEMNEEILNITIEDNGIGRFAAKQLSSKNHEKQTSSGIQTTQERIDLLNFGKQKKLNSFQVIDLHDKSGEATGTKTIISLIVKEGS